MCSSNYSLSRKRSRKKSARLTNLIVLLHINLWLLNCGCLLVNSLSTDFFLSFFSDEFRLAVINSPLIFTFVRALDDLQREKRVCVNILSFKFIMVIYRGEVSCVIFI